MSYVLVYQQFDGINLSLNKLNNEIALDVRWKLLARWGKCVHGRDSEIFGWRGQALMGGGGSIPPNIGQSYFTVIIGLINWHQLTGTELGKNPDFLLKVNTIKHQFIERQL